MKDRKVKSQLYGIVNEAYFESFTLEYNAGVIRDLVWLNSPHHVPSFGPTSHTRRFWQRPKRIICLI